MLDRNFKYMDHMVITVQILAPLQFTEISSPYLGTTGITWMDLVLSMYHGGLVEVLAQDHCQLITSIGPMDACIAQ